LHNFLCRLWSASTEINYLVRPSCSDTPIITSSLLSYQRSYPVLYFLIQFLQKDELETVTRLAREQKEKIILAEEESGLIAEPVFYSVRPHPPKNIPSLSGQTLNLDDIMQDDSGEDGTTNDNAAQSNAVIAEIDLIEAGTVTGWACSRTSDVPGPLHLAIFVNRVQVAEVTAIQQIDLPAAARFICKSDGEKTGAGAAPKGFVAKIPALPQGTHSVRKSKKLNFSRGICLPKSVGLAYFSFFIYVH
jgi:hypothetical protein